MPMMLRHNLPTIYLASRYSRREELQGYAAQLIELKVAQVRARWLVEEHDWDGIDLPTAQRLALDDVADLEVAHCVVVFTEEAGEYRRGGSLVELGMALAALKHVVIVGPAPNVFCTLPSIPRFADWPSALAHIVQWRDAVESERIRSKLALPS